MISFRSVSLRLAGLIGTAAFCVPALAIVATTSKTTPQAADTTYTNVGILKNSAGSILGSGVVVGPHTILTANHVIGSGLTGLTQTFTLGATKYALSSSATRATYTYVPDPTKPTITKTTNVDLSLVTVNTTFSSWYNISSTAVATGNSVTMVGFGKTGVVKADGSGYIDPQATTSPEYKSSYGAGTRRTGVNTVDLLGPGSSNAQGGGPLLYSFLKQSGDAALADKDSGGGWFRNGDLVGISDFTGNGTGYTVVQGGKNVTVYGAANYGFPRSSDVVYGPDKNGKSYTLPANTAYAYSGAIDLTNSQIQSWLMANHVNPVPEPTTFVALGLGALAMLRRRRKA